MANILSPARINFVFAQLPSSITSATRMPPKPSSSKINPKGFFTSTETRVQLGGMLSLSFPSDVAAAAPEVRLSVLTRDDVDENARYLL